MTLPNRPGYQVAERSQSNARQRDPSPHGAHPNSNGGNMHNNNIPPMNINVHPYGVPMGQNALPSLPVGLVDPHQAPLFPYLQQEMMHAPFDRSMGMGFLPENEGVHQGDQHPGLPNPQSQGGNNHFYPSRFTDLFKPTLHMHENFTPDDINERKNFVRSHRLLNPLIELLTTCKKENILPEPQVSIDSAPFEDFGLEDFLESQGIDTNPASSEDTSRNAQREEFIFKLEQLRYKYKEEIEKLNKVCSECCAQMIAVLRDQSSIRPVGEHEAQAKLQKIKHKFDYVKNQLRVCVCSAISALQKQYNQVRKKHKSLPKKATSSLTQWFFEHIQNPYPTEQEKAILAATGGLTLTQVNNWFGNKRIRYKRKCLESESKRGGGGGGGEQDLDSDDSADLNSPPSMPISQHSSIMGSPGMNNMNNVTVGGVPIGVPVGVMGMGLPLMNPMMGQGPLNPLGNPSLMIGSPPGLNQTRKSNRPRRQKIMDDDEDEDD